MENQTVVGSEAAPRKPTKTLDLSNANPEFFAALADAQGQAETVDKDGFNTQARYKYASAEAMIRAARKPLHANGLSFLYTWERVPLDIPASGDIGNQFVCANVRMHFVLAHKSGGFIRGTAELDAIGSRARTPDKAVAATLTYMHGFVVRGLLGLDRDADDEDAVDQRSDAGGWSRGPQQHRSSRDEPRAVQSRTNGRPGSGPHPAADIKPKRPPAEPKTEKAEPDPAMVKARSAFTTAAKRYVEIAEAHGIKPRPWLEVASEAIGKRWIAGEAHTTADYRAGTAAYLAEIADIEHNAGVGGETDDYDQRGPESDAAQ